MAGGNRSARLFFRNMTPASHHGRLRFLPGILCAVGLCTTIGETVVAQDRAAWTTDLSAAQRAARKHGAVVIVIETASDFTTTPFASPASRVFEAATLRDPRIIDMSEGRVAIVARGVDAPATFRKPDQKLSEGAVVYFCDAELRVLHLLIGYPSADRFVEAVESIERLSVELAAFSDEERKRKALRDWHRSRALAASLAAFGKVAARTSAAHPDTDGLPQQIRRAVETANAVRRREVAARFSANWPGPQMPTLAAALSLHGDVRTDFAHLILAELPLVTLAELNAVCFETIYTRSHWQPSSRSAVLHRWFVSRSLLNRPMLLVLARRSSVEKIKMVPLDETVWRSGNAELDDVLGAVDILVLTHAEAATLARDTALALPKEQSAGSVRFLLIDGNDRVVGAFNKSSERRLARAIRLLKSAKLATEGLARAAGKGEADASE